MDILVVEAIVEVAEELAVRFSAVQRGVMLAGQKENILVFQARDDVPKLGHATSTLLGVICRMRQVPGKYNKIRLRVERIHNVHCFAKRSLGIGVEFCIVETPMGVRELDEKELILKALFGECIDYAGKPGGIDNAANTSQP
jgi:hypothetical protein